MSTKAISTKRIGCMKRILVTIVCSVLLGACAPITKAPQPGAEVAAKKFVSPDKAADALVQASQANDRQALISIFGSSASGMLSSGDEVADKNAFERFQAELAKKHAVESQSDGRYVLLVGEKDWPFPIPIVSDGKQWAFDAAAGKEEILDRRIGENELKTIRFCRSYVEAQKEYFKKDHDGDGVREYAQKAISTPGKQDGLFWKSPDGKEESPFGPLAAEAAREGYRKADEKPIPFHGYFFKILTAQGSDAEGGKKSYLDKRGNLTKGFALFAYPARYDASGIMSFMVNQSGVVYEKDLGIETLQTAEQIGEFNPDPSWEPVVDPGESAVDD